MFHLREAKQSARIKWSSEVHICLLQSSVRLTSSRRWVGYMMDPQKTMSGGKGEEGKRTLKS